jgi:hypothetical protein
VTDETSATDPQSRRGASTSALQSAITLLLGGLRPDGSYEGVSEWDTNAHQWRVLKAWCDSQQLIQSLPTQSIKEGGREHDVLFDDVTRRWQKFTKPWQCGYTVEVFDGYLSVFPATALQYLARWKIGNRRFGDDAGFIGIAESKAGERLMISQRDITGETPTWDELDTLFVEAYGMKRVRAKYEVSLGDYEARSYFGGRIGVFDVRPLNCVRATDGSIVPIDVIPRVYGREASTAIARLCI